MAAFTQAQRDELAKKGVAMPDGSFPIRNSSDLRNAIKDFGRSGSRADVKAHIIKRAKALNMPKLIPMNW